MVLIVADIDHFKKVNDRHGHIAGDVALKQFANTLIRNTREDDIVSRFGGEEFVILLRGVSLQEALASAQRLCERVRSKPVFANGEEFFVTASFGVAELRSVAQIEEVFQRADLAVYRAKREGRDRVCVYDPSIDGQTDEDTPAA